MYCIQGGKKIEDYAKFCVNCGNKVEEVLPEEKKQNREETEIIYEEVKESPPEPKASIGVIYGVIALTLVLSIFLIMLLSSVAI